MAAADTAAALAAIPGRGAGTDAERRAAGWLAEQVRGPRRVAETEPFWCRPNWALTHAWHCLAGLVGSLLAVSHPVPGGAIVLASLLSVLCDGLLGQSLGRRLTPEHASQNVVSRASAGARGPTASGPAGARPRPVRLIVTAQYDAGRTGLVYRDALRTPAARLRQLAAGGALTPGWLGWLAVVQAWLVAVAVVRDIGAGGTVMGVVQLVPTAALVVGLALLLELAASPFGPAAGDNAAGVGVAVALVRALDAAPPRTLDVELVLQGAGDGGMIGLRRHLRTRRRELGPRTTIVLGIGPCGTGRPGWWISDGPLLPLRYLGQLRALAERAAATVGLSASTHRGRGTGPAFPARARGLPALTIGCLDARGLAPRSHQPADRPEALDRAAMDELLALALGLVDELDADLARRTTATGRRDAAPSPA